MGTCVDLCVSRYPVYDWLSVGTGILSEGRRPKNRASPGGRDPELDDD